MYTAPLHIVDYAKMFVASLRMNLKTLNNIKKKIRKPQFILQQISNRIEKEIVYNSPNLQNFVLSQKKFATVSVQLTGVPLEFKNLQ